MEDDYEYRQALLDEGYDPDDPHLRDAIADTVSLLHQVAEDEHSETDSARYDAAAGEVSVRGENVAARS